MSSMRSWGMTLEAAVRQSHALPMVRKMDLRTGDILVAKTCNSVYTIRVLASGNFAISGGWFDKAGMAPFTTTIAGCTWGGSMVKVDIVAACGLCIEFGNRVTTSLVRRIMIIPAIKLN